jgi:hypothetical protein
MWAASFDLKAGILGKDQFLGLSSEGIAYSGSIGGSSNGKSWRIIAGNNFGVDINGNVYISGVINAKAGGTIGNWSINGDGLEYHTDELWHFLCPKGKDGLSTPFGFIDNLALGLGTSGSINFSVTQDGCLYASGANIKGHIEASSGSFNGTVTATDGSFNGTVTATSGTFSNCTIYNGCTIGSGNGLSIKTSDATNNTVLYSGSGTFAGLGPFGVRQDANVYIGGDGFSYSAGVADNSTYSTSIRPGFLLCAGDSSLSGSEYTGIMITPYNLRFLYGGNINLATGNYGTMELDAAEMRPYLTTVDGSTRRIL